jgi:hypothetical protein
MDIASRRILRHALGVSLSLFISQIIDWPLAFLAPIFTTVLLSLPIPPPSLKFSFLFVAKLVGAVLVCQLLLPFIDHAPMAGVILVGLALFGTFYYTAMGGDHMIGAFITIGLTLLTGIGSVSIDMLIILTMSLAKGASMAIVMVYVAHALLPDPPSGPSAVAGHHHPLQEKPDPREGARSAIRALVIVFPVALLFLFMSSSASYIVVLIKLAAMGQQATTDNTRTMAGKLIESTVWGGIGAVIAWAVLSCYPSLIMYTLLIALAGLLYGSGIFKGEGMHPKSAMWQYAFLTMIVVLAPTVGSIAKGQAATDRFWVRQFMFLGISVYGYLAVVVLDTFWSGKQKTKTAR